MKKKSSPLHLTMLLIMWGQERKIGNFRRIAKLTAAKKAENKFLPKNTDLQEN